MAALTVLLVVVGIGVSVVAPDVPGGGSFDGNLQAAEAQMHHFAIAIQRYRERHGHVPERLDALTEPAPDSAYPCLKDVPLDPWGRPYAYARIDATTFRLRSLGEDGEQGSDDDILWSGSHAG